MTEMIRSDPYRIAVWGTGDVGAICLREAIRRPDLEVVGAYVYSERKDGVDIGTLVGKAPIGVKATRDLKAFLAIDCDVVLYTALDPPGGGAEQDFITLLKAGKNVITPLPYNYLPARGEDFAKALIDAAEQGGATFFASGVNPDFIGQRLGLLVTDLSGDIRQIKLEEYFDCVDQANTTQLQVIGMGGDPASGMDENSSALFFQRQYWFQMIQQLAAAMGVELSRIEAACYSEPAPEDLASPTFKVPKGRTGRVSYESTGYVGDEPFIVKRVGWYMTSKMKPKHVVSDTEWIVTVEGRPSARCVVSVAPSFMTSAKSIEGEPAAPGYVAFGMTLLHAIPAVVAHPPGFRKTDLPPVHWRRDLRMVTESNKAAMGTRSNSTDARVQDAIAKR